MVESETKLKLRDLRSNRQGFEQMAELASKIEDYFLGEIVVDMSQVGFCDANMCAPLGAVLYRASVDLNTVNFSGLSEPVKAILEKNGFLANYGYDFRRDTYGTTIQYRRFERDESRLFAQYIERELLVGKGLPQMTDGLKRGFKEGILEIFSNSVIHAESKNGIFTCGQLFPANKLLNFTITDLGIGFRENILRKRGLALTSRQAIEWAMQAGNTTKNGRIPGGLGLKLLREFIQKNGGKIQITSYDGYWELSSGRAQSYTLKNSFPGTVVNIVINTADQKTYRLSKEISPEDLF
jgi:hypothetical protein